MGLLPPLRGEAQISDTTQTRWQEAPSSLTGVSPDDEFYGDTSGISFHSLLLDKLLPGYRCLTASEDPLASLPASAGNDNGPTGFLGLAIGSGEGSFVDPNNLPSRTEAKAMWDYFASHTHRIYPFLSIEMLEKSYLDLLSLVENHSNRSNRDPSNNTGWAYSASQDCLRLPSNQPLLALHFLVFALVQALSTRPLEGDGGR